MMTAPTSRSAAMPGGYRLPDAARLGPVRLQIADIARSLAWYEEVLGFAVLGRDDRAALLGTGGDGRPLIELREWRRARPMVQRGRLGLYHYAILLRERAALGSLVRHLAAHGVRPGASDHLVSEALYLRDPDGLGVEVYADRPAATWRSSGGELVMATDPLDLEDLLREAGDRSWDGIPSGTGIGHVHLHVGELDEARRFFAGGLGLEVTTGSYPGALFFAAGGYHHHVATNTWAGPMAAPAGESDARLLEWTVVLPAAADVAAAAESLEAARFPVQRSGGGSSPEIVARDPSGTAVRVIAGGDD